MGLFGGRRQMPVGVMYGGQWFPGSELITKGWIGFAAFAWGNYLETGRGVVWLPEDADQGADGPVYIPASRPSLLADRSTMIRRLNTDLARYNPEQEFVIFFNGARDLKAYHAGKTEEFEGVLRPAKGQPRPPQAYERATELMEAEERGAELRGFELAPPPGF